MSYGDDITTPNGPELAAEEDEFADYDSEDELGSEEDDPEWDETDAVGGSWENGAHRGL